LFCAGQKAIIEKDGKGLILNDPIEELDYPGGKIQISKQNSACGFLLKSCFKALKMIILF